MNFHLIKTTFTTYPIFAFNWNLGWPYNFHRFCVRDDLIFHLYTSIPTKLTKALQLKTTDARHKTLKTHFI